ncbi:hypothetical protein M0R45_007728 [Rubus argutus]|uniref:Uncharacterized protein n=1 Tax=Rubus argutus TaxID=59490 RepID=A0AAW1XZ65_RUBAR
METKTDRQLHIFFLPYMAQGPHFTPHRHSKTICCTWCRANFRPTSSSLSVADSLFHWATDVAAKFGIPRLIFHGPGFFPLCAIMSVMQYQPHMKVSSDSESFVIPNLPHEIKMTRNELPSFLTQNGETDFTKLLKACGEEVMAYRPVSLCNKAEKEKLERGREGTVNEVHECLNWLNSKKPSSVVYICFGSMNSFSDCELLEIALGLRLRDSNSFGLSRGKRMIKKSGYLRDLSREWRERD